MTNPTDLVDFLVMVGLAMNTPTIKQAWANDA
jgi:hypothetical protein